MVAVSNVDIQLDNFIRTCYRNSIYYAQKTSHHPPTGASQSSCDPAAAIILLSILTNYKQ